MYPDWQAELAAIVEKSVTVPKLAQLSDVQEWLRTRQSVVKDDYRKRLRLLLMAFEDMYSTPLLERPNPANSYNSSATSSNISLASSSTIKTT